MVLPSLQVRRWLMKSDLYRANLGIVNLEGGVFARPPDGTYLLQSILQMHPRFPVTHT
jgi:hypothetical protein